MSSFFCKSYEDYKGGTYSFTDDQFYSHIVLGQIIVESMV